jgi:hypothetical protein
MKLWISFVLLLFGFNELCFAKQEKHIFNPKIERSSKYDCGWCNNKESGYCGTMGGCKTIYIYKYPKNIDKMIEENPEFKDEIVRKTKYNLTVSKLKEPEYGLMYSSCYFSWDSWKLENPEEEIQVESCYDLWKYNPLICDTIGIKEYYQFEQHCNKIIKKILKKTGRLY